MNQEKKQCQNCNAEFIIEPEDFDFYKKMKVPAPTWCPDCRFQRRLLFLNFRNLYKRTCDRCKKNIVAMYPADSPFTVYCNNCYWGDSWSGAEYGRKYDPSRPFLAQLIELRNSTPFMALEVNFPTLVNTEYTNYSGTQKNCYMTVFADLGENIVYSDFTAEVKDSAECYRIGKSELSYEVIGGFGCYNVKWSEEIDQCTDVFFSRDLTGCSDCFGCSALRNKKYCMWNEQLTKEEYKKRFAEFPLNSYKFIEEMREKSREFWKKSPRRFAKGDSKNVNVIGEGVYESKNAQYCFMGIGIEDGKYVSFINLPKVKDAYDFTSWGNGAERIYEVTTAGEGAYNITFSAECWPEAYDVHYSLFVLSGSKHCFGCVNLKKKEYCILNKEYTKEEYEALVLKIIEEMKSNPFFDKKGRSYAYGNFLPYEIAPFTYNQSTAQEYFPLTKKEALEQGFLWYEGKPNEYKITLEGSAIPDTMEEAGENITKEIIGCIHCGSAYRIIPQEFDLLKKLGVPLPRRCAKCRYADRFSRENLPRFFNRKCDKCKKDIITSYAPESSDIIYCEKCYQEAVL